MRTSKMKSDVNGKLEIEMDTGWNVTSAWKCFSASLALLELVFFQQTGRGGSSLETNIGCAKKKMRAWMPEPFGRSNFAALRRERWERRGRGKWRHLYKKGLGLILYSMWVGFIGREGHLDLHMYNVCQNHFRPTVYVDFNDMSTSKRKKYIECPIWKKRDASSIF